MLGKLSRYMGKLGVVLITAALIVGTAGCGPGSYPPCPTPLPSQNLEIRDWYDFAAVSSNLSGNHALVNDLDSTTPGYEGLAGPRANQGTGWQPIGTFVPMCPYAGFSGTFDGQGHEIRDVYINRPDDDLVGLFGCVYEEGVVRNVGVTNVTVIGDWGVGGLVGRNLGSVSNSYATGTIRGNLNVGGLVGYNQGPVTNCYAAGNVVAGVPVGDVSAVMGGFGVGGLIGVSEEATVSNCYFMGNVASYLSSAAWNFLAGVGGLVGVSYATVSNSYSKANVIGENSVGGLVGRDLFTGTISNSYFTGSVTGNSSVGGLVGGSLAGHVLWVKLDDMVSHSYFIGNVTGNEFVGGLVGWNEGNNVSNSCSTGSVTGNSSVGGLVGENIEGTVSNSYSTGDVTGNEFVGGLLGRNLDTVSNSYSICTVSGKSDVGGLVGDNSGTVTKSFWDVETSGQATSAGGTGKTTVQMWDIATFSSADWNITAVTNPGVRNLSHVWNIVDGMTYPFLGWQP
jgi:hypothetical protein